MNNRIIAEEEICNFIKNLQDKGMKDFEAHCLIIELAMQSSLAIIETSNNKEEAKKRVIAIINLMLLEVKHFNPNE